MARNRKISEELLTEPSEKNQNMLNDYFLKTNASTNERSIFLQFISFYEIASIPLYDMTTINVKSYVDKAIASGWSPANALNTISTLNKARDFFIEAYPELFR